MNIEEKLLPLIKVFNTSHGINDVEQCLTFIDEIHEALKDVTELNESFKISCGNCVHHSVCHILRSVMKDRFVSTYIDELKLAWICRKFLRDEDE